MSLVVFSSECSDREIAAELLKVLQPYEGLSVFRQQLADVITTNMGELFGGVSDV